MEPTNTINRPTVVSVGAAAEDVTEFNSFFEALSSPPEMDEVQSKPDGGGAQIVIDIPLDK